MADTLSVVASSSDPLYRPSLYYHLPRLLYQSIPIPRAPPLENFPSPSNVLLADCYSSLEDTRAPPEIGPVVRIAPTELSFISAQAWQHIYGRLADKKTQMTKDYSFAGPASGTPGIFWDPDDGEHARLRRHLSRSFSEESFREQEPVVKKCIHQLLNILRAKAGQPFDINSLLGFLLFDITGEISFGEHFNCLQNNEVHPWVKLLFYWGAGSTLIGCAMKFQTFTKLLVQLIPKCLREADTKHAKLTKPILDRRLANSHAHPDLLSKLQPFLKVPGGITYQEMLELARAFIFAGTETGSSTLSCAMYLLLANNPTLHRMRAEIRARFKSASEINASTVLDVEYLNAVLKEAFRVLPAVSARSALGCILCCLPFRCS